ncbi:hypothetical protein [uncultured Hymenobacter sp.]|uniref:hypothetical protein n=1 Tax=uncultured Hymenobacter sp. TaxID=170016 RepID=UPI0035CC15A7
MMRAAVRILIITLALLRLPGPVATAQTLAASAQNSLPLSDSLTRHFLARAMTIQDHSGLKPAEWRAFTTWAGAAGTRFAGRVGGFWYTPESPTQEQAVYDSLRRHVAELHHAQPSMVVQGAIFEILWPHVSNLLVPNALRVEVGEDTLAVPRRNFRFADMMYPGYFSPVDSGHVRWDSRPPGQAPGMPDMSRPETQLWFYHCARRQLDAGIEALHFGQVMLMNRRDAGHRGWWQLLQRVRAYARTRNRGFVLCDAHTHGEFYDPDPAHPLPDSLRQLLFDFHAYPLRAAELDTVRAGTHGARLEIAENKGPTDAIYRLSRGGRAPGGWLVRQQPALVELDNWGPAARPGQPGQWPWLWGLDEISWFATQPSTYRDLWLVYAVAWLRQLDPNTYLEMPGLRGVTLPAPTPGWLYRADTAGQGAVIPAIWAGQTEEQARRLLLIGPVQ